ncbi:type I-C CRISPR-associated protein Cas7/Csd2 [Jannaschia rubra]|uniref:CRISPR-associated protein Cas7/Csd2, subtype I-C/DVULG n=1 Tax=Jannaschia rubra TaxID=282197 RepID=A0A0M6XPU6_9RHOB|nr:type I-C CRISPR-associated protein Cas7/Csd2 [Jannaschia rubra]CTQ33129.1 CRISPR-associated protein Cas7/Csd2, subtype I-C/DVULG [Jannaschia rubra]SFG83420.1 CRISPR-associated protein, Csd2 family [Jannaschia rubra]
MNEQATMELDRTGAGLTNRYDFVLFLDVENGNPNGDPDAGNMPRMDPETNRGLMSDVSIKRKLRNYVAAAHDNRAPHRIYFTERAVLNEAHGEAWDAVLPDVAAKDRAKLPKKDEEARALTDWMCANFWDIRTFGAVMSTGVNAGQVRGPVQLSFARSEEPIMPLEVSITRSSVTNEKDRDKERTMGRKAVVPYGLYRVHGFVNAKLAQRTGFSEADLTLLWTALRDMLDLDRSAARGMMAARRLVVFKHDSDLGNAQAHRLFDRVTVSRVHGGDAVPVGDPRTHNWPPARAFADYRIDVDTTDLPAGVEVVEPW